MKSEIVQACKFWGSIIGVILWGWLTMQLGHYVGQHEAQQTTNETSRNREAAERLLFEAYNEVMPDHPKAGTRVFQDLVKAMKLAPKNTLVYMETLVGDCQITEADYRPAARYDVPIPDLISPTGESETPSSCPTGRCQRNRDLEKPKNKM